MDIKHNKVVIVVFTIQFLTISNTALGRQIMFFVPLFSWVINWWEDAQQQNRFPPNIKGGKLSLWTAKITLHTVNWA